MRITRFMVSLLIALFVLDSRIGSAQNVIDNGVTDNLQSRAAKLTRDIPELMKLADIPGISIAVIDEGKVAWTREFGVINADTKKTVTATSIFEAASLTKVLVAYATLKFADAGKIDIDVPLNMYLGNNYDVGDDPRLNQITTRRVLTHSAGFPNWRDEGAAVLPINFAPGEKFSYSGEGFVYLSKVLEKISGKSFIEFMQEMVLTPLQMKNSSFVWRDDFDQSGSFRHDQLGNVAFRNQGTNYNAAASLRTTAEDYAKFMCALISGTGLKKTTGKEMLKAQIQVDEKFPQVFWGLGLGLEVKGNTKEFWHWGDQGFTKAFMIGDLQRKRGVVYFANSANGLSIAKEILADAVGGSHPSLVWLDYPGYDAPSRLLLKKIVEKGSKESLETYEANSKQDPSKVISADEMNSLGYTLMGNKMLDDAIAVFERNALDHPESANVWDSLAEAYMNQGNKPLAIKYYEKVLQLDSTSTNAVTQLKKLRE
ncbi:MAG: serine hydrolase [Chryseolinea sp.]